MIVGVSQSRDISVIVVASQFTVFRTIRRFK